MAMFNSYVKLPEGIVSLCDLQILVVRSRQDAPLVFIEQAVCAECTTKAVLVRWAHDHGTC